MVALNPNFSNLPNLPEFRTSILKKRAVTHSSILNQAENDNYERLEHFGDSVLEMFVTRLLYELYPNIKVGDAHEMRSLMINNENLAKISLKYDLPKLLRAQPSMLEIHRSNLGIQADLFESYVGGLYLDLGLDGITPWLEKLFTPYANAAYAQHFKLYKEATFPNKESLYGSPSYESSSGRAANVPSSFNGYLKPTSAPGSPQTPVEKGRTEGFFVRTINLCVLVIKSLFILYVSVVLLAIILVSMQRSTALPPKISAA